MQSQEIANIPLDQAIEVYTPQFVAALPDNVPVRRFKRVILTALNTNADLVRCDRRTLFMACIKAAQDGLYPDGREAALVPYLGKVQYQPMIQGIRKRMLNSGKVLSAVAEVVYRNDHFRDVKGDNPHIEHEPPPLGDDRGEMVGAYAVITLSNGEKVRDVMAKGEIERIRDMYSRATRDDAPWKVHPGEMWKKTVLKRCAKQVPFSAEDQEMLLALNREDGETIDDVDYSHVPMPTETAPPRPSSDEAGPNGSKPPPRQRARRAAAASPQEGEGGDAMSGRFPEDEAAGEAPGEAAAPAAAETVDPETGEVIEEGEIILPGDTPPAQTGSPDPALIPFDGAGSQAWYKQARAQVEAMVKDGSTSEQFRHFARVNAAALATLKGPGANSFRSLWEILDKAIRYGIERKS